MIQFEWLPAVDTDPAMPDGEWCAVRPASIGERVQRGAAMIFLLRTCSGISRLHIAQGGRGKPVKTGRIERGISTTLDREGYAEHRSAAIFATLIAIAPAAVSQRDSRCCPGPWHRPECAFAPAGPLSAGSNSLMISGRLAAEFRQSGKAARL